MFNKKFENRKAWEKPNPKQILSQIPGTVIEIKVKEGQKVKENDVLLIQEAMKMHNKITAPYNGVIKAIYAVPGRNLAKGVIMLEFE